MDKRIKVIIPNIVPTFNKSTLERLNVYKSADTHIDVVNAKSGPEFIEQKYDIAWAELFVLLEAEKAEAAGYDAVIINCALDPARTAAREKLKIPVVSLFETALHIAAMLGKRISVIIPPGATSAREELIDIYRMRDKYVSSRLVNLSIAAMSDKNHSFEPVYLACKAAVEEDGADVLILGCAAMVEMGPRIAEILNVPVIEPDIVALKYCEALIDLSLSQSKKLYSPPSIHKRTITG